MSIIFELSQEHESLPKAEIIACLLAEEIKFNIEEEDLGILVVNAPDLDIQYLIGRLALTHVIDELLFSCKADESIDTKNTIKIGEGSFAVRAKRIQRLNEQLDLKEIEKVVADLVGDENPVDLTYPDHEIRVIVSNRCHIGKKLAKIDRSSFEERKVANRPYFSPVSLHPRLARALVNLSRVKEGQTLLDPFCGTGGVLMEAALIGARPVGSDVDKRMVKGCRKNLEHLDIQVSEIFCADISEVVGRVKEVEAIATDPPYGKAATTNREDVFALYERTFETFNKILKPGGYASVVLPHAELIKMGEDFLSLEETHAMRVHRSLTRNFCVYKKE
ncbi:MAG: RsmD family RNA methyltransferase [Thermoplasmata archaeon]|nr:MAG: RsmD family RNA methyltransferase [Thermoplasmata archaeon]